MSDYIAEEIINRLASDEESEALKAAAVLHNFCVNREILIEPCNGCVMYEFCGRAPNGWEVDWSDD